MKDVDELAAYLGQAISGDGRLDLGVVRKELRNIYDGRFESGEYGPNILMLDVALSDKQLEMLNPRQLETFYSAVLAVRRGDSEEIDEAAARLAAVGLDTFVPEE